MPLNLHVRFEQTQPCLKVWLGSATCVFSGIQFTKHFIKFILAETIQIGQ